MQVAQKFGYDKRLEAREVYRTEDEAHPGVAALHRIERAQFSQRLTGATQLSIDIKCNRLCQCEIGPLHIGLDLALHDPVDGITSPEHKCDEQ